jgi:hypothetical protein
MLLPPSNGIFLLPVALPLVGVTEIASCDRFALIMNHR